MSQGKELGWVINLRWETGQISWILWGEKICT